MPRDPIPTWFFAPVVVRQGDRFLLVHEAKHEQGWCVPAGRVVVMAERIHPGRHFGT